MTGKEMRLAIADGRCPLCGDSGPRSMRIPLVRFGTKVQAGNPDRLACGVCGIAWKTENNPDFSGVHAEPL